MHRYMQESFLSAVVAESTVKYQHLRIRETENISRGPTFGDFVTIRTERSMQDITVARLQSSSLSSPLF
jgi:hypothetical protein